MSVDWCAGCPNENLGQIPEGYSQRGDSASAVEMPAGTACRRGVPTCSWLSSSADRLNSVILIASDGCSRLIASLLGLQHFTLDQILPSFSDVLHTWRATGQTGHKWLEASKSKEIRSSAAGLVCVTLAMSSREVSAVLS